MNRRVALWMVGGVVALVAAVMLGQVIGGLLFPARDLVTEPVAVSRRGQTSPLEASTSATPDPNSLIQAQNQPVQAATNNADQQAIDDLKAQNDALVRKAEAQAQQIQDTQARYDAEKAKAEQLAYDEAQQRANEAQSEQAKQAALSAMSGTVSEYNGALRNLMSLPRRFQTSAPMGLEYYRAQNVMSMEMSIARKNLQALHDLLVQLQSNGSFEEYYQFGAVAEPDPPVLDASGRDYYFHYDFWVTQLRGPRWIVRS